MISGNTAYRHKAFRKFFLAGFITCAAIIVQSACGVVSIKDQPLESVQPSAITAAQSGENLPPAEGAAYTSPNQSTPIPDTPAPALLTPTAAQIDQTPEVETVTQNTTTPVAVTATSENTATQIPSPSPTPSIPLATISIVKPGPQSRVLSPIYLEASILPIENGIVRIELFGEDGRVLFRDVKVYKQTNGQRLFLSLSVEFEIPSVAEAGRLSISIEDEKGRPAATASVDMVMLSMGTAEVFTSGESREPVVFQAPRLNQVIAGGNVTVSGIARPVNTQPLIVELVNGQGEVVGSRQVAVDPAQVGVYTPFEIDVPYSIQRQTWARVIVRQAGTRIPGTAMLSSLLFYLKE